MTSSWTRLAVWIISAIIATRFWEYINLGGVGRVCLTTHSTHFIYGYMEGSVLFNDALKTFYLWLYGRKEGNVLLCLYVYVYVYV